MFWRAVRLILFLVMTSILLLRVVENELLVRIDKADSQYVENLCDYWKPPMKPGNVIRILYLMDATNMDATNKSVIRMWVVKAPPRHTFQSALSHDHRKI